MTLTNRPPVAGTNTLNAVTNTLTRIDTAWLLANASDPDNDPLSVAAVDPTSSAGGFVALTSSTVTYTPPPGFIGQDQFAYFISDGQGGTGTGVVLVTVSPFGWQPGDAPLLTRWATNLLLSSVLPEYPRPQMVRTQWLNLNGLWDYVVVPINLSQPAYWAGTILQKWR